MIVINKGSKVRLPKEYHFINNICAYLYDQLTEILSDEFYKDMANTEINFEGDEKTKEVFNDESLHAFDALLKVNRLEDLEVVVTKHVVMSIIADMVNFIYESIAIAQKGKMSVAYSLLRKPFMDQLLILEQIFIDRKDFIDRYFHDGDPQNYDPSSKKLDKKAIIDNSVGKLNTAFLQSDLIYRLRYDKEEERGLNAFTNHALHIVTNDRHYKTEHQGLNFTFPLNDEELDDFFDHYFTCVSMLLFYTTAVVDEIIFDLIECKNGLRELKLLERFVGAFMLYDIDGKSFSKEIYKLLSKLLTTECEICKNKNTFTKRDFEFFFYNHYFACKKCFNPVVLSENTINSIKLTLDPKRENSN